MTVQEAKRVQYSEPKRIEADQRGIKLLRSAAWEPLEGSTPVPLEDVCECRWPVTGVPLFCNEPRLEGSNYCETHKHMLERNNG